MLVPLGPYFSGAVRILLKDIGKQSMQSVTDIRMIFVQTIRFCGMTMGTEHLHGGFAPCTKGL